MFALSISFIKVHTQYIRYINKSKYGLHMGKEVSTNFTLIELSPRTEQIHDAFIHKITFLPRFLIYLLLTIKFSSSFHRDSMVIASASSHNLPMFSKTHFTLSPWFFMFVTFLPLSTFRIIGEVYRLMTFVYFSHILKTLWLDTEGSYLIRRSFCEWDITSFSGNNLFNPFSDYTTRIIHKWWFLFWEYISKRRKYITDSIPCIPFFKRWIFRRGFIYY